MKKYIGTKQIEAKPMLAIEAAAFGYKVGNHENEDGYEVVYEDGYRSWSPKDVFEKAYQVADTPLDRMYIEYNELMDKLNKLTLFLGREDKEKVAGEFQCELMELQRVHMKSYLLVLRSRIEMMKR